MLIRVLDTEDHSHLDRRVSATEARVIAGIMASRGKTACSPARAREFAQQLIGFYPAREVNDPGLYTKGMTALLAAYPVDHVETVCHPVRGLASRLKWLPTLAEVREALDAEVRHVSRVLANARFVESAHEKARAKAAEEAAFERDRPSAEERARQVRDAMRGIKAVPVVEPVAPRQEGWRPSRELLDDLARRKAARESGEGAGK